jgi:hypothetical protein
MKSSAALYAIGQSLEQQESIMKSSSYSLPFKPEQKREKNSQAACSNINAMLVTGQKSTSASFFLYAFTSRRASLVSSEKSTSMASIDSRRRRWGNTVVTFRTHGAGRAPSGTTRAVAKKSPGHIPIQPAS